MNTDKYEGKKVIPELLWSFESQFITPFFLEALKLCRNNISISILHCNKNT